MNCLHISNKPIYPLVDGSCVALANFIELLLNKNVSVKHICAATHKHPFQLSNFPKEIVKAISPESIHIKTEVSLGNTTKSLFKSESFNLSRFRDTSFLKLIKDTVLDNNFDIIVLDSLYAAAHLNEIKTFFNGKIFLRSHNIESELWKSEYDNCTNPVKKAFLKKLYKNLLKEEVQIINSVDGVICISEFDQEWIKNNTAQRNSTTISLGIQTSEKKHIYSNNQVFHLGSMNWTPNIEAVNRLLKISPAILQQVPDLKITLAGSSLIKSDFDTKEHIEFKGFVDDLSDFFTTHGILVSPLITASGVRIKFLEAMAHGVPVITTSIGAKGISTEDTPILIANSDEELVKAVVKVLTHKEFQQDLSRKSKEYIQNYHNKETLSSELKKFLAAT